MKLFEDKKSMILMNLVGVNLTVDEYGFNFDRGGGNKFQISNNMAVDLWPVLSPEQIEAEIIQQAKEYYAITHEELQEAYEKFEKRSAQFEEFYDGRDI